MAGGVPHQHEGSTSPSASWIDSRHQFNDTWLVASCAACDAEVRRTNEKCASVAIGIHSRSGVNLVAPGLVFIH